MISGCVYLVGAGPGDVELLTLKAHRLIQEADVVVYDRLLSEAVLALIPVGTKRVFVGKASGQHTLPQAEINDLLVRLARTGRRVVRLKGGDPFTFGRGGEEMLHLQAHGIPVEVVPGITSAAGCAAAFGIPLTQRGLAHGVRFVTGHGDQDDQLDLAWDSLADPDTTLVVYMGIANAALICRRLVEAGLSEATPVAAIERGTQPGQRLLQTTLALLPQRLQQGQFQSPTLLVIGRVAALTACRQEAEVALG